jgi:hypothetical protein
MLLSALGATYTRRSRTSGSHIKMPLHYHNRIVKELSANSLSELAKHSLYRSVRTLSTPNRAFLKNFFRSGFHHDFNKNLPAIVLIHRLACLNHTNKNLPAIV